MVNKPFPRPGATLQAEIEARTAAPTAERLVDWLLADPGRLAGFMAATGLTAGALRAGLGGPDLALAVLDHLLGDEAMLLAATAELGLPPQAPERARLALGGAPGPEWT